ncbi:MAG: hypothetical protein IPP40_10040 [bacterium]|nr:hypothetical protein [bacterium]
MHSPPHTPSILRRIGQLGFVVVMMCARFSAFGVPPNIEHNWSFPSENHDYGAPLVTLNLDSSMAGQVILPFPREQQTSLRLCDFMGMNFGTTILEDTTTASSFRDLIASSSENSIVAAGGIASGGRLDVVNLNGEVQIQRQTIGNGFQTITSIAVTPQVIICAVHRETLD